MDPLITRPPSPPYVAPAPPRAFAAMVVPPGNDRGEMVVPSYLPTPSTVNQQLYIKETERSKLIFMYDLISSY